MSYQLALSLQKSGARVIVVAPVGDYKEFDSVQPFDTIRCINLGGKRLRDKFDALKSTFHFHNRLNSLVAKKAIDYILVTHAGQYEYITGWLRGLLLHSLNLPTGVLLHGKELITLSNLSRAKKWVFLLIIKRFTHFFCNSRFTAGLALRTLKLSSEPVVLGYGIYPDSLPRPIPSERARSKLNIHAKHVLLTVSRLTPHKGIDMVIRALPEVLSHFPDTDYIVAGTGPDLNRLRKIAKDNGCLDKVRFVGRFNEKSKGLYYCAADIFVMPSRCISGRDIEGFGIVFVEAGFYGLPVIGGEEGGVADAVIEGKTGILVNSYDSDEIAQAILRLLRDSSLRNRLGEAGRLRTINELTGDKFAERVLTKVVSAF